MSDLTVFAEALISTVARAFYDDDAVCLIDVLIRDKFLRDDDMAPRLSLPAKKLRSTLQFLQEEHLVKSETVDDLQQGGSQATKFWYIDYNHAVHTIRIRLFLLRRQLEEAELRARSSSFYLCPGYSKKRCNGRYTEEDAQQVVDMNSGLFLCQECAINYENDPNAPDKSTYTLQLVDNSRHLKEAVDNLRRVNVQLSGKTIGTNQLRPGIYDLIQKVRGKGKDPITSNLPSENFALGIGSKRLAGTGRTAGIKARKLEQQGVADSASSARNYLVGGSGSGTSGGGLEFSDLTNAMGNKISFTVEKGGGARANLLATKRRRRHKLLEAAASRVSVALPLVLRMNEHLLRNKKGKSSLGKNDGDDANGGGDDKDKNSKKSKKDKKSAPKGLEFLSNNIGRKNEEEEEELERLRLREQQLMEEEHSELHEEIGGGIPYLLLDYDEDDDMKQKSDHDRRITFQAQYKLEMLRQSKLLRIETDIQHSGSLGVGGGSGIVGAVGAVTSPNSLVQAGAISPPAMAPATSTDDMSIVWEDG